MRFARLLVVLMRRQMTIGFDWMDVGARPSPMIDISLLVGLDSFVTDFKLTCC